MPPASPQASTVRSPHDGRSPVLFTGVVQATAFAPTALEAEVRAKAAVLSGPEGAPAWLTHGGVVVFDDGSHHTQGFPLCPVDSAAP
jgi:hypothetical protein